MIILNLNAVDNVRKAVNSSTIKNAAKVIAQEIMAYEPEDDYEKLLLLHDYFIDNIMYDDSGLHKHSAVGSLVHKRAVCDGIAFGFEAVAHELGFNCVTIFGNSMDESEKIMPLGAGHAWNIVCFNGKYYHIDPTFDIGCSSPARSYAYFMQTDEVMQKNHSWSLLSRVCKDNSQTFFAKNNCVAHSISEFESIAEHLIKCSAPTIRIMFKPGIILPMNIGEQLSDKIINIAHKRKSSVTLNYTWDKYTKVFMGKLI